MPLPGESAAVYNSSGLAYYRHSDWLGSSRFASTPTQTKYSDTAYAPIGETYPAPAQLADLGAGLALLQDAQDLLLGETTLPYGSSWCHPR